MNKLIFCFDGTCNSAEDWDDFFIDSSVTNILKLHLMFGGKITPEHHDTFQVNSQRSFYYSGVGTRGNWFQRQLNTLFAPSYGDIDDIINEATSDLENYFNIDDEIYIFGFSRGAAIARMFAAQLPHPVKFIGVFDTVAATKGSLDLNPQSYPSSGIVFENGTLGEHIEKAVHLLALDEKRIVFQPTLFNKDDRVSEIWFAGVHSDIGGSYWYDGLSDICLQYMIEQINEDLTVLAPKDIDYEQLKFPGSIDAICLDDLSINPLCNGKLHQQHRTNTHAMTLSPRLMRVNIQDTPSAEPAILHHTVVERFKCVADYRPYSLRNTPFKIKLKSGNLSDEKLGIHSLKEPL